MSNAELILCQIPADMMVPTYAAITDVSSDPDGALRITTDQELVCYINEDTVIKTLDGKKDLDSLLTEWDAQSKVFAEATEQYRIYR